MSHDDSNQHDYGNEPAPGAIAWFFHQVGWYLDRLILWPIADSCRWVGRGVARFLDVFRYRSPVTYLAATLVLIAVAGGLAATYLARQADPEPPPVVAGPVQLPADPPAAVTPATPLPSTSRSVIPKVKKAPEADEPHTLQGVVPDFDNTAARRKTTKKSERAAAPVIKPSPAPKTGALRVAHQFATAFTGYEIGERESGRKLSRTATPKLARELRRHPPKLPVNGRVPKATVLNVVKGRPEGKRLPVSVALNRTGVTSELRLALTRIPGTGWRVSEVRG